MGTYIATFAFIDGLKARMIVKYRSWKVARVAKKDGEKMTMIVMLVEEVGRGDGKVGVVEMQSLGGGYWAAAMCLEEWLSRLFMV